VSKIRWSRSHNAAADLIVHARTTSIHPPISAVHPEFDKPSTCINASIRPATGTRCGPGRPIAAELNLVVLKFRRERARATITFGYVAQSACRVIGHSWATQRCELSRPPWIDRAAMLRSRLRHQGPSTTGVGPRITTPAQKAGQSITIDHNAFGVTKGFTCHSATGCCGATWDLYCPVGQWLTGHRVRSGNGPWAASHGIVLCYPPAGGRGITACRNPYFTT
jgi:hypothetical protein